MKVFFPFLIAFAFSAPFTKIILEFMQARHWLLRLPTPERWHKVATPSMGGIAMFIAFVAGCLIFGVAHGDIGKLILAGGLIFAIGLIDDLFTLPPYTKLVGQIAVACLLLILGIHLAFPGNPLWYIPLTIAWVVGMTNAFNLIDNMDGLAGGIAFISAIFLGILAAQNDVGTYSFAVAIFSGAVLGFLVYNVYPAKIFMGDCGSQWLGFMLAGFTILDTWKAASNLTLMLVTPVLLLAVPIFDTALVTLNRKLHGRPVSVGGKDHSSHRFVALGMSERKTVSIFWGLATLFGLTAIFVHSYEIETWSLLTLGALIFLVILGIFLTDVKVYDSHQFHAVTRRLSRFSLVSRRRFLEIMMDVAFIGGSYYLSYLLRYDWDLKPFLQQQLAATIPMVVGIKLLAYLVFGLYGGIWTYIDFDQFVRLLRTSLMASLATILLIVGLYRFEGFSRTLFAIDFFVLLALMGGSRAMLRGLRESVFAFPNEGKRILIAGAGDAGKMLLSEIRRNRQWNLRPVAIVDDDLRKHGRKLLGIPVIGTCDQIPEIARRRKVERIVIAIPSAKAAVLQKIQASCEESGVISVAMQSLEESLIKRL